jgi:hypothetical protein
LRGSPGCAGVAGGSAGIASGDCVGAAVGDTVVPEDEGALPEGEDAGALPGAGGGSLSGPLMPQPPTKPSAIATATASGKTESRKRAR